ncbi:MAG: bifunctional folylpolyglutamate synthase/dihydrofolate synthase [Tissierellia bacterium]|nr:bifunctional folylpolyglutamate synthase/dihydrofolate synthase [Tissierellia bacterium]
MNYTEAINYINDKNKYGSRLGLDCISKLLELLGNPHLDLKYIHIAGTNGKGSTASYISHMLKEAGYKVGLFTSPYLERFNERISINGENIPDERLAEITERVKNTIEIMLKEGYEHPTTFEIVTTIAFVYFKEENVDFVVLEVGLGGRLDSTNVIKDSLISVITTIDYDHMAELGDTLGKIAYEKAGIIKDRGLVLSYPQSEEALEVIKEVAKSRAASLEVCPMDNVEILKLDEFGGVFNYEYNDKAYSNLEISLIGKHQVYNATLALTAIMMLKDRGIVEISEEALRQGLKNTKWPGRIEVLRRDPTFVIDGAHNMQGIKTLTENINRFKYKRLILGMAILKDKEVEPMVEALTSIADEVVVTEANIHRKMDAEDLEKIVKKYNKNTHVRTDLKEAVSKAYQLADKDDLILFAGSLYLIGDIRKIVLGNN